MTFLELVFGKPTDYTNLDEFRVSAMSVFCFSMVSVLYCGQCIVLLVSVFKCGEYIVVM